MKIKMLDESYLYEMAKIGFVGSLEVFVRSNDPGNIPHFHIKDHNKKHDNEGCIRIDCPDYFDHEGKTMHLNQSQIKELIIFLKSPHVRKHFTGSKWDYLVQLWNDNNSAVEIDEDAEMPDYTLLKYK